MMQDCSEGWSSPSVNRAQYLFPLLMHAHRILNDMVALRNGKHLPCDTPIITTLQRYVDPLDSSDSSKRGTHNRGFGSSPAQ